MNYPHRLHVGKGFCYATWRHEPVGCSMHPAEQGMSTMPLSHWLTFGNTFIKMFAAPFMLLIILFLSLFTLGKMPNQHFAFQMIVFFEHSSIYFQ